MPWKYLLPTHCCGDAASTPWRLSFQANSTPYACSIAAGGWAVSKLPMADIANEYSL